MFVCRPGGSSRAGTPRKGAFLGWHAVKVRQVAAIRVDHRDGRQVPEAFVAEVEYEVPVAREGPDA